MILIKYFLKKNSMEKILERDISGSLSQKINRSIRMVFSSIPVMISNIGIIGFSLINTHYAGHMGNVVSLAAMGIANSLLAIVGIGPLISCNFGFFALVAQVNGTGIKSDLKIICQRGLIFNLILYGISAIILLSSPYILPLLGVQKHIIKLLIPYLYVNVITLFLEIFVDMLRHLLNVQNFFILYPVSLVITMIIHFIQCRLFLDLGFGLISLALSKFLTNIYILIIMVGYMKYRKINGFLVESFEKKAKNNLWNYTENIIPSGAINYMDMAVFEFTTIMASNFDDLVLSTHTVFLNILGLNNSFFMGIGILFSSILGNALGKKDLKTSQILKDNFNMLTVVLITFYLIYTKLTFNWIADFVTDKAEIHEALLKLDFFTYTLCCFDILQGIFANILRTVGQQNFVALFYFLSYYGIGIPLSLLFGVVLKMNNLGWFGSVFLSQAVFCFFSYLKFNSLKMENVISDIEAKIESQKSVHIVIPNFHYLESLTKTNL